MAIVIDKKIYRNIQEQVEKNKNDIAAWTTLDAFGIKVLGIVASDADIPEGTYSYGDAYLVGEEEPYDIYVYTRGANGFVDIGPLTIVGPAGPVGPQGLAGTITIIDVETAPAGSPAAVVNTGTPSNALLKLIIPRGNTGATGAQGNAGPKGETGERGPIGETGPQGDPGESFMIIGTVTNTSQLPDPTETPRNHAYVYDDGDASTPNRLYYITGTTGNEVWSYSPLAAAGTTVSVNGNPVSLWDANVKLDATKCTLQTTAPTADATDGGVHIVYLSADPATKYNGYIYLIANQ